MRSILIITFSLILMPDSIAQIRGTEWGSSSKDMNDGAYIHKINNSIKSYGYIEQFRGEKVAVTYAFVNDKLARIMINISEECDLKNYLELVQLISTKYIDQGEIEYQWYNETFKDDSNNLQFAINYGHVALYKVWKDSQTLSKTLIYLNCSNESGIVLDYGSIMHIDEYNLALTDDF